MFIGHYGASFAGKAVDNRIPLWVLFVAAQLLDIVWAVLVLLGIETMSIVEGFTPANDLVFTYMPFSHALVSAIVWAVVAAGLYRAVGQKRWGGSALAVGAVALSHWPIDWLVHVSDLPLVGDQYKLGLGLWRSPLPVVFALEAGALLAGLAGHLMANRPANRGPFVAYGVIASSLFIGLTLGPPPESASEVAALALVSYAGHGYVAYWLERRS